MYTIFSCFPLAGMQHSPAMHSPHIIVAQKTPNVGGVRSDSRSSFTPVSGAGGGAMTPDAPPPSHTPDRVQLSTHSPHSTGKFHFR
jgi:hypothetical protein